MHANYMHIDINSYFATILQQENPSLRGRPVGVVKSEGRTCVIAASKEAKKFGVRTGCNKYEALRLAPGIIFIPAEFDLYLHCTKKLKALFEAISPDAEIFSLDEAFIPLENLRLIYPNPTSLAIKTQDKVKNELGSWVTCNVGISNNRLLAKMAGEIAPKGSVCVITEDPVTPNPSELELLKNGRLLIMQKEAVLKKVEFKDVCGIGVRLETRLKNLGISHPFEINELTDGDLEDCFGTHLAKGLRNIGRGEESYILDREENRHMKSVGRTITGYKLENRESVIRGVLYNLMEEATFKVRKMDMAGRYVSIFVTGEDRMWHGHMTLKHYVRHTNELFDLLYHQLYKKWRRNFKIIKYGVMLGMLKPMSEIQPTLFADWYKNERLYSALDTISNKYGLFTLRSGILDKNAIIRPEVTGFLGDKKYQFME